MSTKIKDMPLSDLVTAANHIASTMGAEFNANCELRQRLGLESFAKELGINPEEVRDLLMWDWAATGDPDMYKHMLVRGERAIAARLSGEMAATEIDQTLFDAFGGFVFSAAK